MAEQNADCGIAALLRAATSEYLKGCELDEDPAEAATLPIGAARVKAMERAARRRRVTRRRPRRNRPRAPTLDVEYEYDIEKALGKSLIATPATLAQAAFEIRRCRRKDAARALRIIFISLLMPDGQGADDPIQTQILLETALTYYELMPMKDAFLLAMHKHFEQTS